MHIAGRELARSSSRAPRCESRFAGALMPRRTAVGRDHLADGGDDRRHGGAARYGAVHMALPGIAEKPMRIQKASSTGTMLLGRPKSVTI